MTQKEDRGEKSKIVGHPLHNLCLYLWISKRGPDEWTKWWDTDLQPSYFDSYGHGAQRKFDKRSFGHGTNVLRDKTLPPEPTKAWKCLTGVLERWLYPVSGVLWGRTNASDTEARFPFLAWRRGSKWLMKPKKKRKIRKKPPPPRWQPYTDPRKFTAKWRKW